jgi:hypothetical protein
MREAEFVAAFADAWREPTVDGLLALLAPDIRLQAPLLPVTVGREAARRQFTRVLRARPALHAEVFNWAPHDDGVFIEFELRDPPALSWGAVDRFLLDGDLATERVSYFDDRALLRQAARHPTEILKALRSGTRPRRHRHDPDAPLRAGERAGTRFEEVWLPDRAAVGVRVTRAGAERVY